MGGRDLRLSAAAVLAAVVACQLPPSPTATGPASPSAGPASQSPPTVALSTALDASSIELHSLDARFVPADAPVSRDGQILWAAGFKRPSEIWRYVPGASEPERVFSSALADGRINAITASGAGYAFIEESDEAYGKGGWCLWFLPGIGRQPVEVDRGSAPGAGVAPTIAMDAQRIAWAAFDEPRNGPVSRLRIVSLTSLHAVTTLIDASIGERKLWYPNLAGQELWYATIKANPDTTGDGDEFHIEHIDLGLTEAAPVRFPGLANFSPAVDDRSVVWKTVEPGYAALNWGALHVLDRRSQAVSKIPVPNANRPSIGDRYVTFDEISHLRLGVYDTLTGTTLHLGGARPGESGTVMYGGESISGRLLTFFTQGVEPNALPRIGWAMLPG